MKHLTNLQELEKYVNPTHFLTVSLDGKTLLRNQRISELALPPVKFIENNAGNADIISISLRKSNGYKPSGSQKFINVQEFVYHNKNKQSSQHNYSDVQHIEREHYSGLSGLSKEADHLVRITENQRLKTELAALKQQSENMNRQIDDYRNKEWKLERQIKDLEYDQKLVKEEYERKLQQVKDIKEMAKEFGPMLLPAVTGMMNKGQMNLPQGQEGLDGAQLSPLKSKILQQLEPFPDEGLEMILDFMNNIASSQEFLDAYQEFREKQLQQA